jgi:Na+-transporting NADH:ubiquinone oxidoreductase subunit C
MQPSTGYTLGFAASICVFCSIFVAGAAVALKDRQDANKVLDRQKKVLSVAGLDCVDDMNPDEIGEAFAKVEPILVDMEASPPQPVSAASVDAEYGIADVSDYDPRKAAKDPAINILVEPNGAKVSKMARYEVVYRFKRLADSDNPCGEAVLPNQLIVPIQGPGLWSTLYGYISLTVSDTSDTNSVNGLIFYEHAETPGLGGEVDNPKWKAQWTSKKVRDSDEGPVALAVVKGMAKDEYGVDGLSGATITSNGVTEALRFWLGKGKFEPETLKGIVAFDSTGTGD